VLEREGEILLLLGSHVLLPEEGVVEGREEVARDNEAADAGDDLREGGREGGRKRKLRKRKKRPTIREERREGGREGGFVH